VTYPALLGRRYLALSERTTALFLDSTESSATRVTMTLPPGWSLADPLANQATQCPWGKLARREKQLGNVVTVEEDFSLQAGRIPAPEYLRFAQFAGEVDLLQGRDLLIRKK
jgi:cellulose synthase operon protein C